MRAITDALLHLILKGNKMGLDMYAYAVPADSVGDKVTDVALPDVDVELYYWRKFNALHGWMENLYRLKGGAKASFNCTTVRLDAKDLDRLEMDTGNNKLVPINGFFFGEQTIYPEDLESVALFIAKARQALADGNAVYYDSWW
jgi:hypothetical protein